MKKFKFLVLMHSGMFVDENMLFKGIYGTATPILHNTDVTIDNLIERRSSIFHAILMTEYEKQLISEYTTNIRQCTLVEIELQIP